MLKSSKRKTTKRSLTITVVLTLTACVSTTPNQTAESTSQALPPVLLAQQYNNLTIPFTLNDYSQGNRAFKVNEIGNNASGITWDPYRREYFIIQNNAAVLYRYNQNFGYIGRLRKAGKIHQDTEGLSFINGKQLLIATEANIVYLIDVNQHVFERGYYSAAKALRFGLRPPVKNKGLESTAYRIGSDKRKARIYTAIEGTARNPLSKMQVLYTETPLETGFFNSVQLLNLFNNENGVIEPFDAETAFDGVITDIAGMTFDPWGDTLLILSQESKKLIQVNPETGEVLSLLKLSGAPVYEGVTIGPNGELVFVSEKNWVQVYPKTKK